VSNVLNEEKKQQVIALGRLGWSLRRIEAATSVHREHLRQARGRHRIQDEDRPIPSLELHRTLPLLELRNVVFKYFENANGGGFTLGFPRKR
jgi:hypothetical protein